MKQLTFAAVLCLLCVALPSCKSSEQSEQKNDEFALKRPIFSLVYVNELASSDGFVNVRAQPKGNAHIIGKLHGLGANMSDVAPLLASNGEWSQIEYNGRIGYVYNKFVDTVGVGYYPDASYAVIAAKDWTPIYGCSICEADDAPDPEWKVYYYIPKGWIIEFRSDTILTEPQGYDGYWGGCVDFLNYGWELNDRLGYNPDDVVVVPISESNF